MSKQTMTSEADGAAGDAGSGTFAPFAAFGASPAVATPVVSALTQVSALFGQRCAEWQRELAGFVAARMRADEEFRVSLAACRSPAALAQVQQAWIEAATEAYLEETERLGEIATAAVQDGMATWLAVFQSQDAAEEPREAA